MPRVLPPSSELPARLVLQPPFRMSVSIASVRFTETSISMSACSATAWEFDPGACTTATPRRVAAGISTVSSPTPWRPTTFRRLHAAMRLSVQRGRMRKRIPWASAATLTRPASVSSSQTTTRASLSRSALPSGWMGPASTIRGRGSVDIESPFGAAQALDSTTSRPPGRGAERLQGAPEPVHHQAILVVGEVADRAEQVHGQIELGRELHVADVLADQREAHARLAGGLVGALELGLAEVDAGHLVAQAAELELDQVASEAAGRVEHAGAGFEPRDAGDPLHLGGGVYRGSERM